MVQLKMDLASYQDFEIGKILRMITILTKINSGEPEEEELSGEEFDALFGF